MSRFIAWCRRRLRRHQHHPPALVPTPSPNPSFVITTLSKIVSGKFVSAKDKHGLDGTLIQVSGLRVLAVSLEADGDSHITVTDGIVPVFIAEITPVEKAKGLTDPPVGSTVTVTGYPFYDTAHASEAWHGNTGWELHPVVSWQ